jgi:hypothetical protein
LTRRLAPEPNVAALRPYRHLGWLQSESPAGFNRNKWLVSVGIDGWFRRNPHLAAMGGQSSVQFVVLEEHAVSGRFVNSDSEIAVMGAAGSKGFALSETKPSDRQGDRLTPAATPTPQQKPRYSQYPAKIL